MKIIKGEQFLKEFKKLQKKYPSLPQDFQFLENVVLDNPLWNGSKHWNILKQNNNWHYILKTRMMCRSVKGATFRVVYSYNQKYIEILFLEIYFKSNKDIENKQRIDDEWQKIID